MLSTLNVTVYEKKNTVCPGNGFCHHHPDLFCIDRGECGDQPQLHDDLVPLLVPVLLDCHFCNAGDCAEDPVFHRLFLEE